MKTIYQSILSPEKIRQKEERNLLIIVTITMIAIAFIVYKIQSPI